MEKDKLNSDSVWIHLLEITIPDTDIVRICDNNENVTWNGNVYIPFPFEFSEIPQTSKADVPQWTLSVANQSGVMGRYVEAYDVYIKNNGITGNIITLNFYLVNSKDLSNTTPYITETYELDTISIEDKVTFALKGDNLYTLLFPKRRGSKMFCSWKFRGTECKYAGVEAECNKSLAQCQTYNNTINFGGFPAVGGNAIVSV